MVQRTVPTVPAPPGVAPLAAREVDLKRAVRLGLVGGMTTTFVVANGMVSKFSARELVGPASLGALLMLAIPAIFGYLAAKPPPVLQGFAAPRTGWRNVVAGLIAGAVTGVVVAGFAALIAAFDVREVLINVTPSLVTEEPRLVTFGIEPPVGLAVVVGTNTVIGALGGTLHLLRARWRRAVLAGLLWLLVFALLGSLIAQLLRGIQRELRIWTDPVADFLYAAGGRLSVAGAAVVAVLGFGVSLYWSREGRKPVRRRFEKLPERRRKMTSLAVLLVAFAILGLLPQVLGPFLSEVLNIAGIFLLMALGLNIVVGFAGLLDLGYVAFFAVGAYTTALLTSPQSSLGFGWIFWAAIPFVVLAATAAGLIVGTPVLRMRGDYLAIVTLGFGEIARLLFLSDWLKPTFGGAQGIIRVRDITIGPLEIQGPQAFFYAIFVFVVLAAYVSYAVQDSRMGRAWMAMREDETVAEAMGVNIVSAKLLAFIIGAVLAGFGGALFATKIGSIFPHSFNVIVSITVLVIIIVGGMASVPGVVLGALVLVGLPELLREFEQYRFLVYGALLIFMMLRRPEGFIPNRRRVAELHEEELLQDAWLRTQASAGSTQATGSANLAESEQATPRPNPDAG